MKYLTSREASKILGLHPNTLRTYAENGTIESFRTESGHRRYNVESYLGLQKKEFITLCYCRVSSPKQRDYLNRQVEFMQSKYPEAETLFFAMRDQSSKTSAAASIISVKGLKPYWDAQCKVISSKLWLPIKTALQDSDSTLSNGLLNKAVEKSWFSSRLIYPQSRSSQLTYSAFFTYSVAECTDSETIKAKSVKLYSTIKKKRTFKKWHA
jgi:DNA-binding transcriptional MerR regulator